MSEATDILTRRFSLAQLLVHALVIELEAAQSYKELAKLMEQSGNTEVAKLFAMMSGIEARHAEIINEQVGDFRLPELTPWQYHWRGLGAPENIDRARLHYLMTPHQAMSLALENEKRAYEFFADVVDDSTDERARELAAEFAGDERQHVAWVEEWLAKVVLPYDSAHWVQPPAQITSVSDAR